MTGGNPAPRQTTRQAPKQQKTSNSGQKMGGRKLKDGWPRGVVVDSARLGALDECAELLEKVSGVDA